MTKKSDVFEQQIHRLHELVDGDDAEVTWNDRIPDPDNPGQARQIDITIKRDDELTLVECRLHKERQDVKWVEELIGRKLSLRASAVVAVSASGFTQGAIKKAQAHGVFLRDLNQLTPEEVESWGCSIAMTVYYYEYKDLQLSLLFHPESIARLDFERLSAEFKNYHGRQTLFNAATDLVDTKKLLTVDKGHREAVKFSIRMKLGGFMLSDEPVVEVEFSGLARLVEQELTAPALLAYRNPSQDAKDTSVVMQKTSIGETGTIVHNSYKMATILDLSKLEMPPNSQFRYFRTAANKDLDMDSFELLGCDRLCATGGPMAVNVNSWREPSSAGGDNA
jgi:hypothetical protein